MREFYISERGEWFVDGPFSSKKLAIEQGNIRYEKNSFFVGEKVNYEPFSRDIVFDILENEANDVYDECGSEATYNWPLVVSKTDPSAIEANRKIREIMMSLTGKPNIFKIVNVEEIVIGNNHDQ